MFNLKEKRLEVGKENSLSYQKYNSLSMTYNRNDNLEIHEREVSKEEFCKVCKKDGS